MYSVLHACKATNGYVVMEQWCGQADLVVAAVADTRKNNDVQGTAAVTKRKKTGIIFVDGKKAWTAWTKRTR